jgi:tetratricopeptide (TPR) repeat protein
LVTSRERLNLSGETLMEVAGLSLAVEPAAPDDSSAARLFVQSARRLSPHLTASETVARICRLTAGMPLAIELAAAWVRVMTLEDIAQEIERDLDFLAAPIRDVPERHRSLRAVFEHSWRLLEPPEQPVFARLSVFQGGFTRAAAHEVAEASPHILLALTDQSLVTRDALDRYHLHPLVRQYAAEKLPPDSTVRLRHALYYIRLLSDQEAAISGPKQAAALQSVAQDMENIHAAWEWLLMCLAQPSQLETALERLSSSLDSLNLFYNIRCRFQEADTVFAETARHLESLPPTLVTERLLARVLAYHGYALRYNEAAQRSLDLATRSETMMRRLGLTTQLVIPLLCTGYLAIRQGDYEEASRRLEEALQVARLVGDLRNAAAALNLLAEVHDHRGDFARAKECDEAHLALQRQLDDPRGIAKALNGLAVSWLREDAFERAEAAMAEAIALFQQAGDLNGVATSYGTRGNAAQYLGWFEAAERYYIESYTLCRELADFWGEALALHNLGELAAARDNPVEAKRLYKECLELYRQHDIQSGVMNALADLAHCQIQLGDYAEALACLRESISLAREAGETPMRLKALAAWAGLLTRTGQLHRAAFLVALVSAHPSTEETARKWLEPLRLELGQILAPEALAHQIELGRGWSLEEAEQS